MGGFYMGKREKNKAKVPRQKRLNRYVRLQAAPHWIPKYDGENLVKGYSTHFAVDKICAVTELEMLGYSISEEYKQNVKDAVFQKQKQTKKRKAAKRQIESEFFDEESDETFAFIAGYTSGGAPFGITWEEWEHDEANPNAEKDTEWAQDIAEEDLPF